MSDLVPGGCYILSCILQGKPVAEAVGLGRILFQEAAILQYILSCILQGKPVAGEAVGLGRILFHEAVILGTNTKDTSVCQAR